MKKIEAKIVADSISPQGHRITTFLLTYPRFIHGEVMTHRLFSRNSASSRAIPFEKMVKMVEEDPFIPIAWQKDHKGMQGVEYLDETMVDVAKEEWLYARKDAVRAAKILNKEEFVTKQLCNRLLEPFMWHTTLVTATEWENFFELRCPKYTDNQENVFKSKKDYLNTHGLAGVLSEEGFRSINKSQAEIHIQALAEAMWDARNESTPQILQAGEWHIPFGDQMDSNALHDYDIVELDNCYDIDELKVAVAVARCARLSYMTFDDEINYKKDIELFHTLLKNKHMSPFEHVAKCMTELEYYSFIKGKYPTTLDQWGIVNYENYPIVHKKMFEEELIGENPNNGNRYGWCNNLRGFVQYRFFLENKEK